MLSFFRNNESSSAFLLAVFTGLLHLPALLGLVAPPQAASMDWFSGQPFASALAAAVVVFAQAILVNRLDRNYRLSSDRTWLPGLVFVVVASSVSEFQFMSPMLLAATFVPVSLDKIFGTYKSQMAFGQVFDVAFWLSVGALIYPPMFILLFAGLIGLGILRSFGFREQLVFLSGGFVPFFLSWLWFFWHDESGVFWQRQFGSLAAGFVQFDLPESPAQLAKIGLLLGLTAFVLLSFGAYYRKKLIQIQKYISILYWFLFTAGLSLMLMPQPQIEHFLLFSPVIGLLLSFSFMGLRNRRLAEILFFALLGAVIFLMFCPDLSFISSFLLSGFQS